MLWWLYCFVYERGLKQYYTKHEVVYTANCKIVVLNVGPSSINLTLHQGQLCVCIMLHHLYVSHSSRAIIPKNADLRGINVEKDPRTPRATVESFMLLRYGTTNSGEVIT